MPEVQVFGNSGDSSLNSDWKGAKSSENLGHTLLLERWGRGAGFLKQVMCPQITMYGDVGYKRLD